MSRKCQPAYEHVFDFIDKNVFPLSTVATFTTDYEVAMRNALRKINPTARMFACHFHFCQASKKKAMKIDNFIAMIRSDKYAASIYYRLLCLPILPATHIHEAFESLKKEAFQRNKRGFSRFFKYFEKQWIVKVIKFCLNAFHSTLKGFSTLKQHRFHLLMIFVFFIFLLSLL